MNAPTKKTEVLQKMAVQAREHSHSPYSKYKVGSALRLKTGQMYAGCNIENSSYGATVCAERVAIWKAVSELGKVEIEEIVVVTDAAEAWPPCGMCRQVLAEFATSNTVVHTSDLKNIQRSFSFDQLLPEVFNSSFLKK